MDRLPGFALDEILAYLDSKTVGLSFSGVSRSLRQYFLHDSGYVRYFAGLLNLPKEISIPYSVFCSTLLELFSRNSAGTDIDITGFSTTGGMDSDRMQYWVENLFTRMNPPYCTDENQDNAVCAGVLTAFAKRNKRPEVEEACKEAAQWVRRNRFLRNIANQVVKRPDSEEALSPLEKSLFADLFVHNPDTFFLNMRLSAEDRERHLARLSDIYKIISEEQRQELAGMMDDPLKKHVLEAKIVEKERAEVTDLYFCANRVVVSRKGQFSCPLETFVVFVSNSFVPVTAPEFAKYDNLRVEKDVERLVDHNLPGSFPVPCEGAAIREFFRFKSLVQPVLWGKFTSRDKEEIEISLRSIFSGKFLYIKLINSDNRMQEMGDPHNNPNIDVQYFGVKGAVVNLELLLDS